jgi:glutathione S-transferase
VNLPHARAYLSVIKAEERRRSERLDREDPNIAHDQWLFTDAPFIGDLCLVFLVALWHHVERRLLHFAACAADHGERLTRAQYEKRLEELGNIKDRKKRWAEIEKRLTISSRLFYSAMNALKFLANNSKHDPSPKPSRAFVRFAWT